jgi:hypothetical protein
MFIPDPDFLSIPDPYPTRKIKEEEGKISNLLSCLL